MASKLETDTLTRNDVFIVLKTIFGLKIHWSKDEVLKAWNKSRSIKNDEFSTKAREKGNASMKIGQWSKALTMYNEAVVLATPESQILTLALANRAFVWMKLLQFDKARVDLLWILKIEKYPRDIIYKIYQRLGTVLQSLRKTRFLTLHFSFESSIA